MAPTDRIAIAIRQEHYPVRVVPEAESAGTSAPDTTKSTAIVINPALSSVAIGIPIIAKQITNAPIMVNTKNSDAHITPAIAPSFGAINTPC